MKDPYKRLSSEWGSKARKQDSRAAKSTLKKPTREELADLQPERHYPADFIDDGGSGISVCRCGEGYYGDKCPRQKEDP